MTDAVRSGQRVASKLRYEQADLDGSRPPPITFVPFVHRAPCEYFNRPGWPDNRSHV